MKDKAKAEQLTTHWNRAEVLCNTLWKSPEVPHPNIVKDLYDRDVTIGIVLSMSHKIFVLFSIKCSVNLHFFATQSLDGQTRDVL